MKIILFCRAPKISPIMRSGTRSRIQDPHAQPTKAPDP